ncbi:GtrA family protein [Photobacterium aphoticum]|nr:GtrA family protein [Photobacterium aphoticum]PSU59601.1 GtrA family protein [Photobacterium aphoticum]GHA40539.1 hypothetical protein GCM10007086_12650 [Photobacterium aphoticum]
MIKQYQRMFTFAMVGGCGFLVDATSLFVLSHWLPLPLARGAAFWIAATSNWWLNRQLTFRENKNTTPISQQWGQFLAASCVGFIPNVGCYSVLMWLETSLFMTLGDMNPGSMTEYSARFIQCWPYLAMIPGILLGMVINYTLADRWVFRSAPA